MLGCLLVPSCLKKWDGTIIWREIVDFQNLLHIDVTMIYNSWILIDHYSKKFFLFKSYFLISSWHISLLDRSVLIEFFMSCSLERDRVLKVITSSSTPNDAVGHVLENKLNFKFCTYQYKIKTITKIHFSPFWAEKYLEIFLSHELLHFNQLIPTSLCLLFLEERLNLEMFYKNFKNFKSPNLENTCQSN